EGTLEDLSRYTLGDYNATNDEPAMNSWNENVVRYESIVANAIPQFEMLEDNEEEGQQEPNPDAQRFYQLLGSVRKPLWEGSVFF
ncbi:hypothetical protein PIB30_097006, partial [Stylosanthes scabra]|nr:hypothetical protein [Stylosanthes scabra]